MAVPCPTATISARWCTFRRANGGVVQALRRNSRPSKRRSAVKAASNASSASAGPASVPFTPSAATSTLPVSPSARPRRRSATSAASGSGTNR